MPQIQQDIEPLVAGDKLTWEEFEARWDATPEVKRAELIGGIVYIMSPTSFSHAEHEADIVACLGCYAARTPGCVAGSQGTWRMLGDAPQPDAYLCIAEKCGGRLRVDGKYPMGAPELVAEVCHSSAAYDLHQKMDLYHRAGVDEYITVLLREQEVRWHRWQEGGYVVMPLPADGVLRSTVFPGLWLDVPALLQGEMARVLDTLQQGIQSPEHAAFVQALAQRKGKR
ncbi:MAG: Uma2 family endonuclease [Planctomycetota bacterium]|nr:Uma2 family endonuclease [Planctomycetota bacterium]